MRFKTYINEKQQIETNIASLLFLMEQDLDMITESEDVVLEMAINKHLKKAGLKLHKGRGIVDYLKLFVKGAGKVIWYILKGDLKKAEEIVKTLKKEDVLDFLYKLDLGTLHLITGPLHMIDAWTGWDLAVDLNSHIAHGEGLFDIIKQSLQKIKDSVLKAFDGDRQKALLAHIGKLEASIA